MGGGDSPVSEGSPWVSVGVRATAECMSWGSRFCSVWFKLDGLSYFACVYPSLITRPTGTLVNTSTNPKGGGRGRDLNMY